MAENATYNVDNIVVGRSARMRAVFDFVRVIADSDSSVLVTGETGTGKELIANLIHQSSVAAAQAVRAGQLRHPVARP